MAKTLSPEQLKRYRDHSQIYKDLELDGRAHVVCPQCRQPVLLCEDLSAASREEIAGLKCAKTIAAIKLIMLKTGLGLGYAHAAIFHICKHQSCCHCKSPVPKGALLCSQCLAVNLHW